MTQQLHALECPNIPTRNTSGLLICQSFAGIQPKAYDRVISKYTCKNDRNTKTITHCAYYLELFNSFLQLTIILCWSIKRSTRRIYVRSLTSAEAKIIDVEWDKIECKRRFTSIICKCLLKVFQLKDLCEPVTYSAIKSANSYQTSSPLSAPSGSPHSLPNC